MYTAKMAEREERERQGKIDAVNNYRVMLMEQIRTDELLKLKYVLSLPPLLSLQAYRLL
jgi:hypothetical protein